MRKMFACLLAACLTVAVSGPAKSAALPRPARVIVVVEENHTLAQVIERPGAATYLQQLAARGALFTQARGVTHPSQPNYLALFAGIVNTNGDACPPNIDPKAPNLASELIAARLTFTGYAEDLPSAGSTACWAGSYARKHVPWVNFTNVPPSANLPLTAFPRDLNALPTVSFVIPNVDDDMHDGTVQQGDAWLRAHVEPVVRWAQSHNALVIFTWDEGYDSANSIPLLFVGPMVRPGRYSTRTDHYDVLRTLQAMYGLPFTGKASAARTITEIWK